MNMANGLVSAVFRLQSVKLFTERIVDKLEEGVSCVVVLPETVPWGEFYNHLRERIVLRNLNVAEANELPPGDLQTDLFDRMGYCLGMRQGGTTAEAIREFLSGREGSPQIAPDIIMVGESLESDPARARKTVEDVSIWAEESKSARDACRRLPALCLVMLAPESHWIAKSDIFLRVFRWWGFPSMIEQTLLCLEQVGHNGTHPWRAYLSSVLSIGDPFLLARLWEENLETESEIASVLNIVAGERNWAHEFLMAKGMRNHQILHGGGDRQATDLAEEQYPLWRIGALGLSEDYGLALSSVALHGFGKNEEVRHRIWLGQTQLVFPLLDKMRLMLCSYFTRKYGHDWPMACGKPPEDPNEAAATQQSPYNCQFGRLEIALGYLPEPRKRKRKYEKFIMRARRIRNILSHNCPIEFSIFAELLRDIDILNSESRSD